MKKKIIIPLVIVLLLAGAGFGIGYFIKHRNKEDNGKKVYVESVSTITGVGFTGSNRYMGKVEAQESKNVDKDSDKKVKTIFVQVEDEVKKGDKLFEYDTEEMELKLKQLELELSSINTRIATAQAQIDQLNKEKESVPADERIGYTSQIQSLEAQINQDNYEASSKQLEIENQKASMENSVVVSPMDGVIKSINNGEAGENGNSGSDDDYDDGYGGYDDYSDQGDSEGGFIKIMAKGDYRVKATASEMNVRSMSEGDEVIVRSRVDEDAFWNGTISKVDTQHPISSDNYYSEGGESATEYPFYVTVASMDGLLLGQHVYVELDYGQGENKDGLWLDEYYIVMPETAEDKPFVWAAGKDERIEKRFVELGEHDEDLMQYEILSGLSYEDRIAVPEDYIKAGMKVTENYDDILDQMTPGDADYEEDFEDYDEEDYDYEDNGEEDFDGEEFEDDESSYEGSDNGFRIKDDESLIDGNMEIVPRDEEEQ